MIKTSIIVPVYNTAEYLRDCFDSIFHQTQKEIEIIAINDGSTDNSLDVLQEIKKEHPELIILSQVNQGLGATRNRGIKLAKGEFIYFLDSDDCLKENAMEVCYQCAKANQLDIVMFDAEVFGEIEVNKASYDRTELIRDHWQVLKGEEFANRYWLNAFYPSACLIYSSADFLRKNHISFMRRIYYEDNEFHCKVLPLAERVMYIPRALYQRRCREASIVMSPFDRRHAIDYLQMIQAIGRQQHSSNMEGVIHGLLLEFLGQLLQRCRETHILSDFQFAKTFFDVARDVCGGAIENINSYKDIEVLYQISNIIPDSEVISEQMKRAIQNKKKEVLELLFADIPLNIEGKCVGIYGTGKCTKRFLSEYRMYLGDIKAKRIFIGSYAISREQQYDGCDIYNVNDIGGMSFDCIVVSSSQYEQEIVQTLKRIYGDRFKIICLSTDLNF